MYKRQVDAAGLESEISDAYVVEITASVQLGDVNGDGDIDIQDVMAACRILARKNSGDEPSNEELAKADMNGDKAIDILDVMLICRILARNA